MAGKGFTFRTVASDSGSAVLRSEPVGAGELQILRAQSRVLSDPGERCWAKLLVVMKGEREVRPTGTPEFAVRTNLLL